MSFLKMQTVKSSSNVRHPFKLIIIFGVPMTFWAPKEVAGYEEKGTAFVIGINLGLTPESATCVILNKSLHLSRL